MRLRKYIAALVAALLSTIALAQCSPTPALAEGPPQPWVTGVDVSRWQGPINWDAVRNSGHRFAFVKVSGSDGNNLYCAPGLNYTDPYGAGNLTGAAAAGLDTGAYHFACPGGNDPAGDGYNEAVYFIAAGGCRGTLGPVLDLETSQLGASQTVAYALAWVQHVRDVCGKAPIIYTGAFHPWSSSPELGRAAVLWLAWYPAGYQINPNPYALTTSVRPGSGWGRVTVWQYTSSGRTPGINGNVDTNVADAGWYNSTVAGLAPVGTPVLASAAQVQLLLNSWGFDCGTSGVQDAATFWCVAAFQDRFGLTVDGVWGEQTQAAATAWLVFLLSIPPVAPPPTAEQAALAFLASCTRVTLRVGATGPCVKLAQTLLVHSGYNVETSGEYGYETAGAAATYERDNGLPVDAEIGGPSWSRLVAA